MLCGPEVLEWSVLVEFDKILRASRLVAHILGEDQQVQTFIDIGPGLYIKFLENSRSSPTRTFNMGQLLYIAENRRCKEAVDKIWAVLGLLPGLTRNLIQTAGIIDYSPLGRQHYWQSYKAVMKHIFSIDRQDFFYSITRGQGFEKHPQLPSWCPDWYAKRLYNPLQVWDLQAGFEERLFSMDQVETMVIKSLAFLTEDFSLFATGHVLDVVQSVSSLPSNTVFRRSLTSDIPAVQAEHRQRLRWMEECISLADEVLHGAPELIEIVCQTLVAFDGNKTRRFPKDWQKSYQAIGEKLFAQPSKVICPTRFCFPTNQTSMLWSRRERASFDKFWR